MQKNLFVVGTGRCGSTLISNILKAHPQVLSLSEFFTFITDLGTLIPAAFPKHQITAEQFWQILATPYGKQNLMQRQRICMDEVLYHATPESYFTLDAGVPALMQTTLPHLTTTPEVVFEALKKFVLGLPGGMVIDLYNTTFTWLCQHFGKAIWAERSGGSLRIVHRLYEHFPEAKFLHVVRDGRTTALSMQKHYGFRMVMIVFQLIEVLGVDPYESTDRQWTSDIPNDIDCFLPEHFDAEAFKNYHIDSSLFGHYWSGEIIQGLEEFKKIPPQQTMTIKYEDILTQPTEQLQAMGNFMGDGMASDDWITRCAQQVKAPRSSLDALFSAERVRLEVACKPGMAALAACGVDYF